MALNQKERSLTGIEFDRECFIDGCEVGMSDKECDVVLADLLSRDLTSILGDLGFKADGTEVSGLFRELDFGLNNLGFEADKAEVSALFPGLDFGLNTGTMRIHQDGNCELFRMNFKEGLDGGHGLEDDKADGGDPSDALLLALGYLRSRDLLAVERVCKSLRDAVRGDPLLWESIHIEQSFSNNITDDILIKLTNRAQGRLHSLSLYRLSEITDVGLMHVLERNPSLTKLSVPGCMRLTADGILSNLKVLKTAGKIRLKYLGIYGLFGVTSQHLEEFKLLIGVDNSKLPTTRKPRFFGSDQLRVTSDDHAVDIEVCPKCQKLELVYDCPSESCQKKQSSTQLCRACTTCIARCINCGCCLSGYLLCLDCWRQPLVAKRGSRK